jgi:N utilization substance protein A
MVVNELRGEKIDIVPFSEDPPDFVAKALSPAKVKEVRIDEETGTATVIVPDFQLSLAIGKEGQNARLAARLTGWRVDIKSEQMLADEEAGIGQGVDDTEYAEGEWKENAETGELEWHPAEGGPALTADQWEHAGDTPDGEAPATPDEPGAAGDEPAAAGDNIAPKASDDPEAPENDVAGTAAVPATVPADLNPAPADNVADAVEAAGEEQA